MKISFSAGRIGFYVYLVSVTRREREKKKAAQGDIRRERDGYARPRKKQTKKEQTSTQLQETRKKTLL